MQADPATKSTQSSSQSAVTTAATVIGIILAIIVHIGAAKLSYDKYGSVGWSILAFIFATFYYPYYAFFVSGKSTSMMGGYLKKLMKN